MLLFYLASLGTTFILIYSKLFDVIRPPKEKYKGFFHCSLCLGFWIALFYLISLGYSLSLINILLYCSSSAFITYIISMLAIYLEREAHK